MIIQDNDGNEIGELKKRVRAFYNSSEPNKKDKQISQIESELYGKMQNVYAQYEMNNKTGEAIALVRLTIDYPSFALILHRLSLLNCINGLKRSNDFDSTQSNEMKPKALTNFVETNWMAGVPLSYKTVVLQYN